MPEPGTSVRVSAGNQEVVVTGDRELTIGRGSAAHVRVDNPIVSRIHAVLRPTPEGWVLEDAGSSHGMFLAGHRVMRVLVDGPVRVLLGASDAGEVLDLVPVPAEVSAPPPQVAARPPQNPAPQAPAPPPQAPAPQAPAPPSLRRAPAPAPVPAVSDQRVTPTGLGVTLAAGMGLPTGYHQLAETPQKKIRIGRSAENDIVIEDPFVSRYHAEIVRLSDGRTEVIDLNSANGTFVNGQSVRRATVVDDDLISVHDRVFRLSAGALEEYVDSGQITFEARNLTVTAPGGQVLLDDVSFSLEKCSLLAVVGPTGAGKSTLLNAVSAVRPARSGAVKYGGRDLYRSYDELRHRIGIVPQDDVLHTDLVMRRALEFSAELRFPKDAGPADRAHRIDEVLGELGLSERQSLRIRSLSGGQRKRTSIALELLTKPSLLFLDEPTSGLDPGYDKAVMALLRQLADGGRTIAVITHSLQNLSLCDRVLVLAPGGRTAYFGPPSEVLAYFGTTDWADVFVALETKRDFDWAGSFALSALGARYLPSPAGLVAAGPEAAAGTAAAMAQGPADTPATVASPKPRGRLRQFSTLSRRYLASILADRKNLALLLFQAPVLGVMMLPTLESGSFNAAEVTNNPNADGTGAAVFVVVAASWLGASNAVREIVKERAIFNRERLVGLSPAAYIASKMGVLGAFTMIQAAVLTLITFSREHGPATAAALGNPQLELIAGVGLSALAMMSFGLFVSASVRSGDKALTLLPLLVVPQLVLTGALTPLGDKPGLNQLSYLASARWGTAAVSSTADMNELNRLQFDESLPPDMPSRRPDVKQDHPDWAHDPKTWLTDAGALVGLIAINVLGAWIAVCRRPSRL